MGPHVSGHGNFVLPIALALKWSANVWNRPKMKILGMRWPIGMLTFIFQKDRMLIGNGTPLFLLVLMAERKSFGIKKS